MVFSNVAQSRTSLSIWPWNALWGSAKSVSLTTWGQSYKSKLLSDLSLISEVMFFDGTKDSKPSMRTAGLLKQGMKGLDAWGWCTGTTQRDGMGREEGGGFRMGNTCIPVADSF